MDECGSWLVYKRLKNHSGTIFWQIDVKGQLIVTTHMSTMQFSIGLAKYRKIATSTFDWFVFSTLNFYWINPISLNFIENLKGRWMI